MKFIAFCMAIMLFSCTGKFKTESKIGPDSVTAHVDSGKVSMKKDTCSKKDSCSKKDTCKIKH